MIFHGIILYMITNLVIVEIQYDKEFQNPNIYSHSDNPRRVGKGIAAQASHGTVLESLPSHGSS